MSKVVSLVATPKGTNFVRSAIAAAIGGDSEGAASYAARRWGADSFACKVHEAGGWENVAVIKGDISAGATVGGNWASIIVDAESAMTEFWGAVREASLLGKVPFRRVPMRVRTVSLSTGFMAGWTAQGQSKPISKATFAQDNLQPFKVTSVSVHTRELLASTDPASEGMVRDDMVKSLSLVIDYTLMDPAGAGVPGLEPQSITNTAVSVPSSGDGLEDLRQLINNFPGDLSQAILVGSPQSFAAMHDPAILPTLGIRGGTAIGLPAVPCNAAMDSLSLVDPSGIALAVGDTIVRISTQADVEISDGPTGDSITATPTNKVSLWQTDSVGVLAEQYISWRVARPAVSTLNGVPQS